MNLLKNTIKIVKQNFKKPLAWVAVYLLLAGISDAKNLPFSDYSKDAFLVVFLFIPLGLLIKGSKKDIPSLVRKILKFPNYLIFLYIIWGLLTLSFSIDIGRSFSYIIGGSTVFLAGFLLVEETINFEFFKKFLYAMGFAGLLASVYAWVLLAVQFFNPYLISTFAIVDIKLKTLSFNNIPFLESYFRHPNIFGSLLFYSLISLLILLFIERKIVSRRIIYLASFLILISFIFTFSRGPMLSTVFFAFLMAPLALKSRLFYIPIVGLILILFLAVTTFASIKSDRGIARPFGENIKEARKVVSVPKRDLSGRESLWESSINYIIENPILGAGFGNSIEAIEAEIPSEFSRLRGLSPHSTFLRIGVESGLPGLILYVVLLLSYLKLVFRKIKTKKLVASEWLIAAAVISSLVFQFFESIFLLGTSFRSFYFLIILAVGLSQAKTYENSFTRSVK